MSESIDHTKNDAYDAFLLGHWKQMGLAKPSLRKATAVWNVCAKATQTKMENIQSVNCLKSAVVRMLDNHINGILTVMPVEKAPLASVQRALQLWHDHATTSQTDRDEMIEDLNAVMTQLRLSESPEPRREDTRGEGRLTVSDVEQIVGRSIAKLAEELRLSRSPSVHMSPEQIEHLVTESVKRRMLAENNNPQTENEESEESDNSRRAGSVWGVSARPFQKLRILTNPEEWVSRLGTVQALEELLKRLHGRYVEPRVFENHSNLKQQNEQNIRMLGDVIASATDDGYIEVVRPIMDVLEKNLVYATTGSYDCAEEFRMSVEDDDLNPKYKAAWKAARAKGPQGKKQQRWPDQGYNRQYQPWQTPSPQNQGYQQGYQRPQSSSGMTGQIPQAVFGSFTPAQRTAVVSALRVARGGSRGGQRGRGF